METSHAMDSRLVADQSGAPASGASRGGLRHGGGLRRVRGGIVTFGQACALALFGTVALAQEPPGTAAQDRFIRSCDRLPAGVA